MSNTNDRSESKKLWEFVVITSYEPVHLYCTVCGCKCKQWRYCQRWFLLLQYGQLKIFSFHYNVRLFLPLICLFAMCQTTCLNHGHHLTASLLVKMQSAVVAAAAATQQLMLGCSPAAWWTHGHRVNRMDVLEERGPPQHNLPRKAPPDV